MQPFLLFDLDGTLVDTANDLLAALNALLRAHDIPPCDRRDMQNLIGRGAPSLIERGFGERLQNYTPERRQDLLKEFISYYEAHLLDDTSLYSNVPDVLAALQAQHFAMAICTGKGTRHATAIVEGLGIAPYFKAICGGDRFPGAKKPDKGHVIGTIEQAGHLLENGAIFIGDSGVDLKAAKNAGIPIIYATYGYNDVAPASAGADALINHFTELPVALASINTVTDAIRAARP